MEIELENLQKRVAELEAALAAVAAQQRPWRRRWRRAPVGMLCAGIVAIGLAATLAAGTGATPTPQGPSKVVAPFEVVDGTGRTLFKVAMGGSGAGIAVFYDLAGDEYAVIAKQAEKPIFQALQHGILKAGMGVGGGGNGRIVVGGEGEPSVTLLGGKEGGVYVSNAAGNHVVELDIAKANSAGHIRLSSNTQAQTILNGEFGIRQTNAQGQPVAQLYVDDNGQGSMLALNRAGVGMAKVSVAADGSSGLVEVSQGGEIKATMGVKEGGKGDLCVEGRKGLVCLSGVAIKSLIPW